VDILNIGMREHHDPPLVVRPDDSARWLELFYPFTSVQSLEIHYKLEPFIAAALQGLIGESAAAVFPALSKLSINGFTRHRSKPQGIQSFATARQHSHHPIVVNRGGFR
jgi:hypothetical protein